LQAKSREDKWVAFEISRLEGIDSQDPQMEDTEAFKDGKIAFTEARHNSETESLCEEGQDDRASEEIQPRKSGRQSSQTVREEQENKDILLGSQQTMTSMVGTSTNHTRKPSRGAANKGGTHSNPLK